MSSKKLTDVFDVKFLQRFQNAFSDATGMASICTDLEGPVTQPSNFTEFCDVLTRGSETGLKRCVQCDLMGGEEARRTGKPSVYFCHAGLMDFGAPIIVDGEQVGSILGGQVLTEKPDEAKFREIAVEIGVDPDRYVEALHKVKIVPEKQIRQAAELLYLTMKEISNVQTQYYKLEKSHEIVQENVKYIYDQVKVYSTAVDSLSQEQQLLLERLQNLNRVIDNVNRILSVVSRVSQKIKIISINASVEAARSGVSGKGFAVIAQEIRSLADETSKTVGQIEVYTGEILDAANQVLQISQNSTNTLEIQGSNLESIFPKLNQIVNEIENLNHIQMEQDETDF